MQLSVSETLNQNISSICHMSAADNTPPEDLSQRLQICHEHLVSMKTLIKTCMTFTPPTS